MEIFSDEEQPCSSKDTVLDWQPKSSRERHYPETITLNLKQKEWIKNIIPAADRLHLSNENLFYLLSSFLRTNNVDLDSVIISPTTINRLRKEVEMSNFNKLQVSLCVFI